VQDAEPKIVSKSYCTQEGSGSPPAGFRSGAPAGGLWDEVSQKLKNYCWINMQFSTLI